MSERIEQLIKRYPEMVLERDCIRQQLLHFRGVTETDIIDSMNYGAPQGDRVQSSNIADKTASIAISYQDRVERINREWLAHLSTKLAALDEELSFLQAAIRSLPGELSDFMEDLVVNGMTWDSLEGRYHISRRTVSNYRKRGIQELDKLYTIHEKELAAYLLQ